MSENLLDLSAASGAEVEGERNAEQLFLICINLSTID